MSTMTIETSGTELRGGIGEGIRQTMLMMRWQWARSRQELPMLVLIQLVLAAATVAGYGLLVGDPTPEAALYLATGAPTLVLITVGLVAAPQQLAQSRTEGSMDWMRTLPMPRLAFLFADLLLYTLLAIPGMVVGVLAGVWRFDVHLQLAPWVPLVVLAVSATSAAVGYAMATLLPPMIAQMATQLVIFVAMLFSPISYPASRLPDWLQSLHEFLPLEPMAALMRAGLASNAFDVSLRQVLVLAVWCVACVIGAGAALSRRR
jgi:ABC-2 type transport system permease protein